MIPLGLKETKEVNFIEPFSDFILEHYSEESDSYQDAIADISDTRQVNIYIYTQLITRTHTKHFLRLLELRRETCKASVYCSATTIFYITLNDDSSLPIAHLAFTLSGMTR